MARECAHARNAHPARLFVGGWDELLIFGAVNARAPWRNPAFFFPAHHGGQKLRRTRGEILTAHVDAAHVGVFAGQPATAGTAFVEDVYRLASGNQRARGSESGKAATNDGNGGLHKVGLVVCELISVHILYNFLTLYNSNRVLSRK